MSARKRSDRIRNLTFALSTLALLAAAPIDVGTDAKVADAAMRGDRETVRTLLKQGVDVNTSQGDGMTALHWAAAAGDVELAEMLLYAGANVRASTRLGGFTPLVLASKNGHAAMIAMLVESGADPNATTTTGTTPVMLAAASGYVDAVTVLLDRGASVNATESARGETALMFASAANRVGVVDVLLKRGAEVKVATKVVDVVALEKADQAIRRRQRQAGVPSVLAPTGRAGASGAKAAPKKRAESATSSDDEDAEAPPTARTSRSVFSKLAAWFSPERPQKKDADGRALSYGQLIGARGGLTALLLAARQGNVESAEALLEAGADINQVSGGDKTSPLLIATINGHFDLAKLLLDRGADPNLASDAGTTPLYATLNVQWAPKALYPQPRAYQQQKITYLDLMSALLEKGAQPNARLKKKIWYSGYNFDLSGVDESGATPFWRAAYAGDVDAMRLLAAHGADPNLSTIKPPGRPRTGDGQRDSKDVSGLPPVPVGGPAVTPLQAAAGVGYGEGFAANSHQHAPGSWLPAVKYLVEELGANVNAVDHEGNTALHHAAARGDNEMILYLVSKGANVKAVNREGQTTADMANGAVQRVQPFPETVALLVSLGAKNNHKCVSC